MSGDMMSFPDNWWTFVQQYQFADKEEVYTNGSMLIQSFRVNQMVDHYFGGGECETCHGESDLSEWVCSECQCWIPLGLTPKNIGLASEWRYCPHCGRKVKAVKQ